MEIFIVTGFLLVILYNILYMLMLRYIRDEGREVNRFSFQRANFTIFNEVIDAIQDPEKRTKYITHRSTMRVMVALIVINFTLYAWW